MPPEPEGMSESEMVGYSMFVVIVVRVVRVVNESENSFCAHIAVRTKVIF